MNPLLWASLCAALFYCGKTLALTWQWKPWMEFEIKQWGRAWFAFAKSFIIPKREVIDNHWSLLLRRQRGGSWCPHMRMPNRRRWGGVGRRRRNYRCVRVMEAVMCLSFISTVLAQMLSQSFCLSFISPNAISWEAGRLHNNTVKNWGL